MGLHKPRHNPLQFLWAERLMCGHHDLLQLFNLPGCMPGRNTQHAQDQHRSHDSMEEGAYRSQPPAESQEEQMTRATNQRTQRSDDSKSLLKSSWKPSLNNWPQA
jgi:hypothetical protein